MKQSIHAVQVETEKKKKDNWPHSCNVFSAKQLAKAQTIVHSVDKLLKTQPSNKS